MEEKKEFGIENIKKVISALVVGANTIGSVLEDGKITVLNDGHVIMKGLFAAYNHLGDCEWSKLLSEFLDLDHEEQQEIRAIILAEFDMPQKKVEADLVQALLGCMQLFPVMFGWIKHKYE